MRAQQMWKIIPSYLPEDGSVHVQTHHRLYEDNSQSGHQPPSSEIRRGYESGVRKYWSCCQFPLHAPPRAQSWDTRLRSQTFPMLSLRERFPAQRDTKGWTFQNSCHLEWSKVLLWHVAEHWHPGQMLTEPMSGIQLSPLLLIYCN